MTGGRGRGRLIAFGIAEVRDAPAIKTLRVVAAWTFEAFLILLAEGVLLLSSSVGDLHRLVNVIGAILLPLPGLLIITLLGVEFDGIYETGVSSRSAILWETMTGRGFQPFSGVETIVRVQPSEGRPSGILLLAKGGKWRVRPFWDEYANDFHKKLESTLKARCPSARWIEVPFDEQSLLRKRASWGEARRSGPGPSSEAGARR